MVKLPRQLSLDQLQTKWASIIDPVITNPTNQGLLLTNIKLISGTNTINHKLGRDLQGWIVVRRRQFLVASTPTAYDIYDTQDTNQMQSLTLKLTCSQGTQANPVIIDLEVY